MNKIDLRPIFKTRISLVNSLVFKLLTTPAIFAVLLWFASPAISQAQPAGPGALLRRAYFTLSVANQDYKGHRYEAMKEIEAAARVLKFDLRGDGKGGERQGVSDEQLRAARSMLDQARAEVSGRARKHVDKAIRQIDVALKIR
jgi:hypothetical protein